MYSQSSICAKRSKSLNNKRSLPGPAQQIKEAFRLTLNCDFPVKWLVFSGNPDFLHGDPVWWLRTCSISSARRFSCSSISRRNSWCGRNQVEKYLRYFSGVLWMGEFILRTNTIALSCLMIILGEFKNSYYPLILKDVTRMFIVVWLFQMVFLEEPINDKRHFNNGHSTTLQNQESKDVRLPSWYPKYWISQNQQSTAIRTIWDFIMDQYPFYIPSY